MQRPGIKILFIVSGIINGNRGLRGHCAHFYIVPLSAREDTFKRLGRLILRGDLYNIIEIILPNIFNKARRLILIIKPS